MTNWTTEMNIFNSSLNTTEVTSDWPLNETSTMFEIFSENDTFSILTLPLSSGRHGKQNTHHILPPHPEHFSPVLLSNEWRPLSRLLFLTILSCIGRSGTYFFDPIFHMSLFFIFLPTLFYYSVGNIFMISSVMIEDQLKKAGKHSKFNVISSIVLF